MNSSHHPLLPFYLSAILIVCFYAGWLFVIARQNPDYLRDFRAAVNPDAQTYVQLGMNIWQKGEYSRNPKPPYRPDFKWTPVFPLLAGAAWCIGGTGGILLLNVLLTLATAGLLARMIWVNTRSLGAAFCVFLCPLLDPLIWSLNLQVMSDVAFLFFLTLGASFLTSEIRSEGPFSHSSFLISDLFAGFSFSLAILTRPTGLYLPVVLLLAVLGGVGIPCGVRCVKYGFPLTRVLYPLPKVNLFRMFPLRKASTPHHALHTPHLFLFLLAAYLPVVCWMARNELVFGKFTLSGNQNIVMVYYTGGGAWQMAEGGTLEEAQKRIETEFHLPPCVVCHNPEAFGADPAEIDVRLAAAKWAVLLRYPKALVLSSGIGVVKAMLAHETQTLREITHSKRLGFVFVWSLVFQGTILLLAACSVLFQIPAIWRFTKQNPTFTLTISGAMAYFILTMMLSGMDCCARYRLPLMPLLYVAAACLRLKSRITNETNEAKASSGANSADGRPQATDRGPLQSAESRTIQEFTKLCQKALEKN